MAIVRNALLFVEWLISLEDLLDFDDLGHLNLILAQVEFLQLVVWLQIQKDLGCEWRLQHVVAEVERNQFVVVSQQICQLRVPVRYHVLGQVQMFEARLWIDVLVRIHVESVAEIGRADLRDLIVSKADLHQAHVVAEAAGEHVHETVVDVAWVEVQYLERGANSQVVGSVLRCQAVLVMLRELQDVLVENKLLQFLLLIDLGENALESDDRDAHAS